MTLYQIVVITTLRVNKLTKKLFNHYAGIGPKSYYSNLRLAKAQKLVLAGETVTAIAEKLNFSSVGYFTIFFKNQTGYTPSLYRKIQH